MWRPVERFWGTSVWNDRWSIRTGNWAFAVSRFVCPLFEGSVCFNDVKVKCIWKILFYESQLLRDFECRTENGPTSQGFNMFIPLYNSLYIKYNLPPCLFLYHHCREQMVWMDWTKFRLLKLTETSIELVWTGTQIGDSSEEVEKWAENPDLGSPNIK